MRVRAVRRPAPESCDVFGRMADVGPWDHTVRTDRALSRGRSTVRAPWPVHGAVSGGHTYDVNRGVPSTVKNVVSHVSNVRLHARGTEPDTDLGRRGPPVPEIGLSTDHRMLCGEAMS